MLVLDTNVISEAFRPEPDARVKAWLEAQPPASVFTTAISQAEILCGIALLPKGRRQAALLTAAPMPERNELFADVTDVDFDSAIEATAWGPARRMKPPLVVEGSAMRWDYPASALGSSPPRWAVR